MEERKIRLFNSVISIVFIFSAMIGAIIKSIFLIHNGISVSVFENSFANSSLVLYSVLLFNIIFAVTGMILLLVQFGLILNNNEKAKTIGNFGKIILILSSIFSIIVVWFITNINSPNGQFSFYDTFKSYIISLVIAVAFFVYENIGPNYIDR